jgi:catechol 2,3-dioxygenase-like lactoylglutathione lyase family enzyme
MAVNLRGIDHVGIVVQNLENSIAWYQQHLGFELLTQYDIPIARVAFIARGDLRLELFETQDASPMPVEREQAATNLKIGGINHFALAVDDLDDAVATLTAAGVEIVSPPRDVPDGRGDRFAFIRDNERMLIEIFQSGE